MAYKRPGMAVYDVLSERNRQMTSEGFSEEHDDTHVNGEIARGAASYALYSTDPAMAGLIWPFENESFKPVDPRANLIKAAAMIIAEIERIDRAEKKCKSV